MTKKDRLSLFFGTGFYSGFLKPAPGTWGTLTTFPLFFVFLASLKYFGFSESASIWIHFGLWVFIALFGVYFSMRSAIVLKTSDPSQVVIDEISAYGFVLWWGIYRLYLLAERAPLIAGQMDAVNRLSNDNLLKFPTLFPGTLGGIDPSNLIISFVIPSFIFFRFFDAVKPWPIRILDKWCKRTKMGSFKNGFGIMADDWLAAVFTILVIELIHLAGI